MAYIDQTAIERRISAEKLVELTDDDQDGVADAAVLAEVIADADAIVDSYVGTRYAVPIEAPVPQVVELASVDMAIYRLAARRGLGDVAEYQERKKDAMAQLKDIQAGKATLGIEPTKEESIYVGGTVVIDEDDEVTGTNRVFTRDKMESF